MKDRTNKIATDKTSGQLTSGFAKVRQSEIVLEYFSEIVDCRTCRKAAWTLAAMRDSAVRTQSAIDKLNANRKNVK